MLGPAITEILTNAPEVTAIVQNRIYPMAAKEQALPSIYYNVSIAPHYNSNGYQMNVWTVEILTMCKGYADAWDLANKIFAAMHRKRRRKVLNVEFTEIRCLNIADDYEFNITSNGTILKFEVRTQNIV